MKLRYITPIEFEELLDDLESVREFGEVNIVDRKGVAAILSNMNKHRSCILVHDADSGTYMKWLHAMGNRR